MQPTFFLNVVGGQPAAGTLAAGQVGAAATNINNIANLIRSTAGLMNWNGPSKDAQQNRLGQYVTLFGQLLTTMTSMRATTTAGAAQMQAAKTATVGTATAAQTNHYLVQPTGVVQPGAWHYAFANTHPGAMGVFRAIAGMLTGKINASVAASKSVDMQVAAAIAQVALEYLGGWLDQKFFPSASTTPGTTLPPGTGTVPGTTVPITPGTTTLPVTTTLPPGTTVTGITPLGTQLAGAGALGGASALGGGPFLSVGITGGAGASAITAGLVLGGGTAGAPSSGVIGGTAAGRGGTVGAGMAPMMPMSPGGAAGTGDADRKNTIDNLTEDEEPWQQGEAPDAVLK